MKHLDLFSGIGGFTLAAQWVWGDEHDIHAFVEIDPFCQKVLWKHWPDVPIISDIREYKHDGTTIDLLTGGPPCKHTSVAAAIQGCRTGETLYPEMDRIIRLVRPEWCIVEQPPSNQGWENQVAISLEEAGYYSARFERQASDCGLPHRRWRVFIIANSSRKRLHEVARIGRSPTINRKPWTTPPRGTWRSARTGDCRMDNGVSFWVDRLRALGNAIVPQVVVPIMRAIKEIGI